MTRFVRAACAGAVLFALLPAAAPAADAPKAATDKKLVCQYMLRTGTRFKTKTCRTMTEWDKMTEENRKAASELIDRPTISTARGN